MWNCFDSGTIFIPQLTVFHRHPPPSSDTAAYMILMSWVSVGIALTGFTTLELIWPIRERSLPRLLRWTSNLGIFVLNVLVSTIPLSVAGVGIALLAQRDGWGVFNVIHLPFVIVIFVSFIVLDGMAYVLHRIFHAAPVLWAIHAVHHSDVDVDASTAIRHHPAELIVGALLNLPIIVLLGLSPLAILVYTGAAAIMQTFHHSNLAIPMWLSWLGYIVVVPQMHHVHHSVQVSEANSNYSALFSWWDKLAGTLEHQPNVLKFGVEEWSGAWFERVDRLIALPMHIISEDVAE